jgi:hypothetical protein
MARVSSGRRGPAYSASLDLPTSVGFNGTTRSHRVGLVGDIVVDLARLLDTVTAGQTD